MNLSHEVADLKFINRKITRYTINTYEKSAGKFPTAAKAKQPSSCELGCLLIVVSIDV